MVAPQRRAAAGEGRGAAPREHLRGLWLKHRFKKLGKDFSQLSLIRLESNRIKLTHEQTSKSETQNLRTSTLLNSFLPSNHPPPFFTTLHPQKPCSKEEMSGDELFEWAKLHGIETFGLQLTGSDVEERGLKGVAAIEVTDALAISLVWDPAPCPYQTQGALIAGINPVLRAGTTTPPPNTRRARCWSLPLSLPPSPPGSSHPNPRSLTPNLKPLTPNP